MSTITARHPHHLKKPLIAAACGAALVLAVAVSIGAWLLTQQDTRTAEEAVTQTAPMAVAPGSVAPPVSDQEMYQRWLQTGARPPQPAGAALRQAADDTTTCGTRAAESAC